MPSPLPNRDVQKSLPQPDGVPQAIASLVDQIDALLPQTQCQRCGYTACRPYAKAIAEGLAAINRCPPGGRAGIAKLAAVTGQPQIPLDPKCGAEGPLQRAVIDATRCIGCTLCIAACPVDAIVGGFKFLHEVIDDDCTGCGLCLPPCPVDCITMISPAEPVQWGDAQANEARLRFVARQERLTQLHSGTGHDTRNASEKQQAILAAARARAAKKKAGASPRPPDAHL
jgi:Na+-translocating ferredoxin:NAD+ oxidoreductase subunit B